MKSLLREAITEQWRHYESQKNLAQKYAIQCLHASVGNLQLVLVEYRERVNEITMNFRDVYDYRVVHEGFRINLIGILSNTYGDDFYGKWTFFKIINSLYVQKVSEELDISGIDLTHFVVLAGNLVVDIVTSEDPTIELCNTKTIVHKHTLQKHGHKYELKKFITSQYSMDFLDDTAEDLRVVLSNDGNPHQKIILKFPNGFYSYRFVKSDNKEQMFKILAKENNFHALKNKIFFEIENSHYLKWLAEESCGISDMLGLHHFVFIMSNGMLEIINGKKFKIESIFKDTD